MLRHEAEEIAAPIAMAADPIPFAVERTGRSDENLALRNAGAAGKPAIGAPLVEIPSEYMEWVLKLLHRLRRKRLFRKLAANPSTVDRLDVDTIDGMIALLRKPGDNRWRERVVACWALGMTEYESEAGTSAIVEALCAVVGQTVGRPVKRRSLGGPRFWKRGRSAIMRTAIAGYGAAVLLAVSIRDFVTADWDATADIPPPGLWEQVRMLCTFSLAVGTIFAVFAAVFVLPISLAVDMARNDRARTAAALALGRMPRVESISALAAAMVSSDAKLRQAAMASLLVALPLLTHDHYGRLGPDLVPNLCRAMDPGSTGSLERSGTTASCASQLWKRWKRSAMAVPFRTSTRRAYPTAWTPRSFRRRHAGFSRSSKSAGSAKTTPVCCFAALNPERAPISFCGRQPGQRRRARRTN